VKILLSLLAVSLLFGCSKKPEALRDEFFVEWLKNHGEINVVVDSKGVGIAGNGTRMSASLYKITKKKEVYTAEVHYTIRLPADGTIREYVAGIGPTEEKAVNQAMGNFVLTTAHVVYKAFINPADEHQTMKSVVINNRARDLFSGDLMILGKSTNAAIEFDNMPEQIQSLISTMPLDSHTHWIKIVYSQFNKKPVLASVSLDNNELNERASAVQNLKWPVEDDFYMAKQFIVIK
jgi:hypothetical protein